MMEGLVIMGSALSTAMLALVLIRPRNPAAQSQTIPGSEPLSLLFDNGVLHHATDRALGKFAFFPGAHVWDDLRDALRARFPDLPEAAGVAGVGHMTLCAVGPNDPAEVEMNWRDGLCWVQLTEDNSPKRSAQAAEADEDIKAICCDTMTTPAWETDDQGQVSWRNRAYDALLARNGGSTDAALFPDARQGTTERIKLTADAEASDWYEVTSSAAGNSTIHHAVCVSPLVASEDAQRAFVQTLAKTFAHLRIGLAIFDRSGQLCIFNPALVDLSGLQPQYLATQPTMLSFFDQLRESRRMPEPKNYKSWRQEIAEMISAATDGQYEETWMLDDGRTYAVQGRPHPDGATAFLIEDISSEVTLTRNFRTEIEQYEAMLDHVEDAMVVFSATGILTFCNRAYRDMWGQNPEAAFADVTITDAVSLWNERLVSETHLQNVTSFVMTLGQKNAETLSLPLSNGSALKCDLSPISADSALIRFCKRDAPETANLDSQVSATA
ncbi:MAG: PAS-domain containing protein [Sulfitobacter sp.]